ncbi:MAG: sensor histidine kinase [Chloroflexi bacterium]|nr:sensor histidine kinase [Chloroflexota bacterium]
MDANLRSRLERLSPAQRFMLGSLAILTIGMAGIGTWVTRQIEEGVVDRTAATTALYVDSLVAPPLQDLAEADTLSPEAIDRLDWLFEDTPLGQEVVVFQVWDPDGHIVYSTVPDLVGQAFPVEGELASALAGTVSAEVGEAEGSGELPPDVPHNELIEIYSPIRSRSTGEVIGAAEFYYAADDLRSDVAAAQRESWLVVGGATLVIYLLLATFIQRVSNTVRRQQRELAEQVTRLTDVVQQNQELHERVRGAAARTAALNERFLRRFSAEVHDGPAQEISLALLRLDHVAALAGSSERDEPVKAEIERELDVIQNSLRRSLKDVRATSSGLLLPHLGALTVAQTLDHVVRGHQRRTGLVAKLSLRDLPTQAPLATKIALYRIVQEALTNAWRHADGATPTVTVAGSNDKLTVEVADPGPGFDPSHAGGSETHLGLVSMRERAESLGGQFHIESAPGRGTRAVATLPLGTLGGDHD